MSEVSLRAYHWVPRCQRSSSCEPPASHQWRLYAIGLASLAPRRHTTKQIPLWALCYDVRRMSSNDSLTSVTCSSATNCFTVSSTSSQMCLSSGGSSPFLCQFSVRLRPAALRLRYCTRRLWIFLLENGFSLRSEHVALRLCICHVEERLVRRQEQCSSRITHLRYDVGAKQTGWAVPLHTSLQEFGLACFTS